MYVIRRVWAVPPMQARQAASIAAAIAQEYERAGQREDVRVFYNQGTVPGEKDRVYMEWLTETISSPHRAGHTLPERALKLQARLREYQLESWIEFNELMTPDKALPFDE